MYTRAQNENILKQLKPGFVVVLYGARRTGKTVLLNDIRQQMGKGKVLSVVGEDLDVAEILPAKKIKDR